MILALVLLLLLDDWDLEDMILLGFPDDKRRHKARRRPRKTRS